MHLYRSIPKSSGSLKPVKIEADTYFTNDLHNNNYLRIVSFVSLTLTNELDPEFYCKLRVFEGGQLRILTENCICKGLEGTFVEENQTCEIIRLENGDFELIRNRPVNVDNFTRIGSIDTTSGFSRLPMFVDGKIRLMNGGALLQEFPSGTIVQITDMATYNSEGNNLSVYTSSNILQTVSSGSWLTEIFFEQMDMSYPPSGTFAFTKLKYVSGVSTLPVNMTLNIYGCLPSVQKNFVETANVQSIIIGASTGVDEVPVEEILCHDKPNLTSLNLDNPTKSSKVALSVSNAPVLTFLKFHTNDAYQTSDGISIVDCPLLNNIQLTNYYARVAGRTNQKNIDQILIDLDTNGVVNGTLMFSSDFVYTASGAAAITNLNSKGWTVTDYDTNTQIL